MVWVALKDVADKMGVTAQAFRDTHGRPVRYRPSPAGAEVLLSTLPGNIQKRCHAIVPQEPAQEECAPVCEVEPTAVQGPPMAANTPSAGLDMEFLELYNNAPHYNRVQFDTYYPIVSDYQKHRGTLTLAAVVEQYNQEHPEKTITVKTVYAKLKKFREGGKAALLGGYGKNRGKTTAPESMYETYKACIEMNTGVSKAKAWQVAAGLEIENGSSLTGLPKVGTLDRAYKNRTPNSVAVLAREGFAAYNRKCAPYIKRDDSGVLAGEYWMADHFLADTLVMVNGYKKPQRAWVTVWADVKSRMILSAFAYIGDPNADDIFTAIYAAMSEYGAPSSILVDNGKDFRAKDLTGGRKGSKRLSMAHQLGMKVHFAIPYNPQTKHIERMFRTLHASTSVWFKGFCGGSVAKKPECLEKNVASGAIETFDEFVRRLQDYVVNVQPKMPFTSGHHKGLSPSQIWNEEYPIARKDGKVREIPIDQLDKLCYRTSKDLTMARGGIRDSDLRGTYIPLTIQPPDRRKVYLERLHSALDYADVYDAATCAFICSAKAVWDVPFNVDDDIGRDKLKEASNMKGYVIKATKEAAVPSCVITPEVALRGLGVYAKAASNDDGTELSNIHNTDGHIMITSKAEVLAKIAAQKEEGLQDMSILGMDSIVPPRKKPLFGLEADRDDEDDFNEVAIFKAG
ncbi:MAG: hypothetical protein FWC23_05255 [Chitinispirillia bacterium]|nr:hypothetical protein [Chitinispirillia bacterium]MCL2268576.1 hypothetical protein [Chitinispirillia bacterium]